MNVVTKLRRFRWTLSGRLKIKKLISENSPGKLKIILGAGGTAFEGWISTDMPHFNILKEENWKYFFRKHRIDCLLAEHVLEHLTEEEVSRVLSFAHHYLKPAGSFRIAVPDGYHSNSDYINYTSPPFDGHQSSWTVDSLQKILTDAGFKTDPLEFYTREGIFKGKDFDFNNGTIVRSKIKGYKNTSYINYSSLIIDAYKPERK